MWSLTPSPLKKSFQATKKEEKKKNKKTKGAPKKNVLCSIKSLGRCDQMGILRSAHSVSNIRVVIMYLLLVIWGEGGGK